MLVLSPPRRTVLVIVIESNRIEASVMVSFFDQDRHDVCRTQIPGVWDIAMLSTRRVQNSDFLAVGCGLNDCSRIAWDFVVLVLSEAVLSPPGRTVLVLDGCSNCGVAGR